MTEGERRAAIVAEALSWRRTRWGHHQRLKGVESDCAGMVAEVYERCGEIPHIDLPLYQQDVMLHRGDEVYFENLRPYFKPTFVGRPGDLAMFRWGRMEGAQGCVVVDWPMVVGAIHQKGVMLVDASERPLRQRISGFWTTINGNL